MVGYDTADDAAVYRVNDDTAIIQTVDFFPPMVDDPYLFGAVAAANALSDIYAMGGTPRLAMNLLCFPSDKMEKQDVAALLKGGADKVLEAGALLCGGHTIEDQEPKYGLCVTGFAHPDHILTNSGAKAGDALVLTKPLGSGVLATALKAGLLSDPEINNLMNTMTALNAAASTAMVKIGAHAATDITGFGLMGHASEMARGSGVTLRIQANRVPLLPGALDSAKEGIVPGGAYRNRDHLRTRVTLADSVPRAVSDLLFDPQTSGGLLISLPPYKAEALVQELKTACPEACVIGEVLPQSGPAVQVV